MENGKSHQTHPLDYYPNCRNRNIKKTGLFLSFLHTGKKRFVLNLLERKAVIFMSNSYNIPLKMSISSSKPTTINNDSIVCPFCSVDELRNEGRLLNQNGQMLWLDNKYPMLEKTKQTLIIETNNCIDNLSSYSEEYAKELFDFAFKTRNHMMENKDFKDVLFFKNQGAKADGSVHHAHMQLVGLYNHASNSPKIEETLTGAIVYQGHNVKVTVSDNPMGEKYEFNVIWKTKNHNFEYVKWVQQVIRYFTVFKGGRFSDYNFYYYEKNNVSALKIVPRGAVSIYFLGFGLKQVPDDIHQVAEELIKFSRDFNS